MKIILAILVIFSSLLFSGCALTKTIDTKMENGSKVDNKDSSTVPLPQQEDIVRTFFNLISEKRIPEAIAMMEVPEESKQAWGVQLDSFESLSLKKIEKNGQDAFMVVLTVKMKAISANGPIPYYGYEEGDNVRWIGLRKGSDNLWKITGFATSPINID